jgi:glycosyltransferase involved in cell wall biosynthesis
VGTIYYLIPDLHKRSFSFVKLYRSIRDKEFRKYLREEVFVKHKPVGGVKVTYQHCLMLRELGYDAYPLIMGDYIGDFFGYDLEVKHIDEIGFELSEQDVIVAPEFSPYLGLSFQNSIKIIFNQSQSWRYHHNRLTVEDEGKNFIDMGYDYVINCSQHLCDKLKEMMGVDSYAITNGIDTSRFFPKPEIRVNQRVLALSRKHPEKLKEIMGLAAHLGFDFHIVDGLTEAELIQEYQQSDIFLATGYPEGLPLPQLEAMNCGCVVIGFSGGGGDEYMINGETALVAQDGDCDGVVELLAQLQSEPELKERIRNKGLEKAETYSLGNTKQMLKHFFEEVIHTPAID